MFKKISQSKKASSELWWILAVAIIAFLVVILVLLWFRNSGGKAFGEVESKINSLGDCDGDNVPNLYDKCDYDTNYGEELPDGAKCNEPIEAKENCLKCGKIIC